MRGKLVASGVTCALLLAGPAAAHAKTHRGGDSPESGRDIGRATLGANDGWGAYGTGTTGGADATEGNVSTVSNRQELIDALGGDNDSNRHNDTAKIVYVDGTIRANVDAENDPLACADYAVDGYTREAYLEQYDPQTWGSKAPSGPLEQARARSQDNQAERVRINVGPNTTLVGLGNDARMIGVNLYLKNVDNVIVRNIEFANAYDCFPQWDPSDSGGKWNSEYDNVSLIGATHVWIDHCTFNDGALPDSELPTYFGATYQMHDGLLDITDGADYVTASYNEFREHNKALLIGSTDDPTLDRGHLNVTLHHNLFADLTQRAPRVRFGKVHVYNNLYIVPAAQDYLYSWGVGVESKTYAQNNYFVLGEGVPPAAIAQDWRGSTLYAENTLVNGRSRDDFVDVVAAYNAVHEPDFSRDVGWEPALHTKIDPTQSVPAIVRAKAGAGSL